MGSGTLLAVMLSVGVVFTIIIGSGLLFFQSTLALDNGMPTHSDEMNTMQQSSAIVILILFIVAGLLFLAGAARWVARTS